MKIIYIVRQFQKFSKKNEYKTILQPDVLKIFDENFKPTPHFKKMLNNKTKLFPSMTFSKYLVENFLPKPINSKLFANHIISKN